MAKVNFSKLNLKLNKEVIDVTILEDVVITVRQYLPQVEKAELIQFVISNAIDERTGCFSPIRIETYFLLGIVKYYTDIIFTDKQIVDAAKTYDLLESNDIFNIIIGAIPEAEVVFLSNAVNDTAKDIARFNNSFAGLLSSMSSEATTMDAQLQEILTKIKNKEGIEELSAIREIVG